MYARTQVSVLKHLATLYPIIGITGPRQSGKTTLAKTVFNHLPYVLLEDLDTRALAHKDPRAFLAKYQNGAIFDEIQNVPELLSYLQGIVDADRTSPGGTHKPGRYVLTGSQNFTLSETISQSLPGRIAMTTLLPLSLAELTAKTPLNLCSHTTITSQIFSGGYPGLHNHNMHPLEFYPHYINMYLERDVRSLKNIGNLSQFQTFLKLCAGRIGQPINFSSLAQDCAITHTTARQWLTILEASYIIFTLRPYYNNFSKRLVKMPKLYFYDTGLACNLLGLEQEEQLESHYLKGGLFENLVILEILKGRLNKGLPPNLYFWRDHTGHEIDLVGEWGGTLRAIEIKMGMTFKPSMLKQLTFFSSIAPNVHNYLVYTGTHAGPHSNVTLVPLNSIDILL